MSLAGAAAPPHVQTGNADLGEFARAGTTGRSILVLAVPDAYCAACIDSVEHSLRDVPGVVTARVNLSRRHVRVEYATSLDPVALVSAVTRAGYRTYPVDQDHVDGDPAFRDLLRATAVAGFAAGNIMLFSVSIWAGADEPTRNLFHWISALIALPAILYAGQPFFRSAFSALRAGRTNMDVPISIGVTQTTALSLFETITSGEHAYFDASTMLLFFLLVGRSLDHMMRVKARSSVENLARLSPRGAHAILADGSLAFVRLAEIEPGMTLLLRAGDRVPVDCRVRSGEGPVDMAVVTGESMPLAAGPDMDLPAGAMNLSAALTVTALRKSDDSFLSRMQTLMEAAENTRTAYRRIADRAARLYAPVIHVTAAATFIGWIMLGAGWHAALLNAVAVLIITCPCALALAVPIVHVIASGLLFENGIVMRDGSALERLAAVRRVAFDKTGTLTTGNVSFVSQERGDPCTLDFAAGIAARSGHPLAVALAQASLHPTPFKGDIAERPGMGIVATNAFGTWRLGSADFCGAGMVAANDDNSRIWLASAGEVIGCFKFADAVRGDARDAVADLERLGLPVEILSGDQLGPVLAVAAATGIAKFSAALGPEGKQRILEAGSRDGQPYLMVGDGINDAPALRSAHVSVAPSSATDIGRAAADFILTNQRLNGVPLLFTIARRADMLVRQNLAISVGYNALVLPLAITGHVTPLVAALAMSSSSILVVLNAMRLRLGAGRRRPLSNQDREVLS